MTLWKRKQHNEHNGEPLYTSGDIKSIIQELGYDVSEQTIRNYIDQERHIRAGGRRLITEAVADRIIQRWIKKLE